MLPIEMTVTSAPPVPPPGVLAKMLHFRGVPAAVWGGGSK
jgi:hypothetical protein